MSPASATLICNTTSASKPPSGDGAASTIRPAPWPDSLLVISGAIWGLIPSSGPHAIWVTMSLSGLVPWAALVANALSQSGHDILPLFAVAWRDALVVKLIALLTGIVVGLVILMLLG